MAAGSINLPERYRGAYAGMPVVIFWMTILSLLPAVGLFGGMAFLIMALAVGLAVIVWVRPQEAPGAGMLYLFACSAVFPSAARLDFFAQSAWEMYYWSAGLLIITFAAVARIGARRVFAIPTSARAFLAVALIAALYGLSQGATASYVLRQFYGVLLLIVYLGIALHVGSQTLLMRRINTFGILCALLFFVYLLAEFAGLGFHREMTTVGTQASMLATVLCFTGLGEKKRSYVLGAIILLCVPSLIFQRRAVLTFLLAVPLAAAIKLRSKKLRLISCLIFILIALPGFLPSVAQKVGDTFNEIPVVGSILPSGSADSDTLLDRNLQLVAAVSTVQAHPLLGVGLGGEIEWESPFLGHRQIAYVDNGWAYLLQKMGLLGAAAFLYFLITVLRSISRNSLGLSACLLAVAAVTMFSEPVFFHFTTAPFVGTFAGLLLPKKYPYCTREAAISPVLAPPRTASPPTEGI